jgi:hypothetical protein
MASSFAYLRSVSTDHNVGSVKKKFSVGHALQGVLELGNCRSFDELRANTMGLGVLEALDQFGFRPPC